MTTADEALAIMNEGQQPPPPPETIPPEGGALPPEGAIPPEGPPPPTPPSWEDLTAGKVKSAEEFDKLYAIASKFAENDDAVKVAQMWMSGEGIEDLLHIHNANYDKMDPESLFYKMWEEENSDLAVDPDLTPKDLRDEFEKFLQTKYPGYDPDAEHNNLGKVGNKMFMKDAEGLRAKFNEGKKAALQLKLDKPAAKSEEAANESLLTPESIDKHIKGLEGFKSLDLGEIDGEKVSIPVPEEWIKVATAMAKDPDAAYEARYIQKSEDGKGEVFDSKTFDKDQFVIHNLDKIAKYYFDLGKGVTAEEQAIALGQKTAKAKPAQEEAGGDLEAVIAEMESKRR